MGELIRLNLGQIDEAVAASARIGRVFDATEGSAHAAADACGHDGLADAVRRFADNWDHHREKFADALDALGGSLSAIASGFRELDSSLYKERS